MLGNRNLVPQIVRVEVLQIRSMDRGLHGGGRDGWLLGDACGVT